ncbi:MAG: adenylosuccinate synthase [Thermoproteota archaeon]
MPSAVIVGTQYGDEGKGKVVDYYASEADIVVRFQGGSNVGHTVKAEGRTFKFNMLPSGAVRGKKLVIGNGVVVDPERLLAEIDELASIGKDVDLLLSERAHIILPFHKIQDELEELAKGPARAGTTKQGVGPTYADKAARFGIRVIDLMDDEILHQRLSLFVPLKNKFLKDVFSSKALISESDILARCISYREKLHPYVGDVSEFINNALDQGKRVLFEGGQGTLLDLDHGVYPFGTSSNTVSGAACTGAGVGPRRIDRVLGVCKAYVTRVGDGPFPTEIKDEMGNILRERGREFGTLTGRPRRCGWLDGVALRYSAKINSLDALAVTKLDVLAGLRRVLICNAYEYEGRIIRRFPADLKIQYSCNPIYEEHEGWKELTQEEWMEICSKGYDALPHQLKEYIRRIEEIAKVPICLISFGPEREATISLGGIFEEKAQNL